MHYLALKKFYYENYFLKCLVVFSGLGSLLFLTNCKRNHEQEFVVTGRIVDNCNNSLPVANASLDLHGGGSRLLCKSNGVSVKGKTDANGYFTLIYQGVCPSADELTLEVKKTGYGFVDAYYIAVNQDKDLGTLSIRENLTYKIAIETDTAYSSSDTLFYDIRPTNPFDSSYQYVTGPFANNTVIDTIITEQQYLFSANPQYVTYNRWILKNGPRVYKPDSASYHHTTKNTFYNMKPCEPNLKVVFKINR
jgi:hypothetical protein